MSDPNNPEAQASVIAAERDRARDRAQRSAVSRDPSNMYPGLLRLFATVAANCENMYDDIDGETHLPVEDSDQIASAGTDVSRYLGCRDQWSDTSAALRAAADRLAGRLRVLDLLMESDGYVVCASCDGHGAVYINAACDDATCNDCHGRGYVYADKPAPNRWRNVEGETWWRPDADCHVWRTANVWWWAIGSGDTLRCGSADSYDEARQDADDYIAGMWAERIQDTPACPRCYDSGIAATTDGEAMDCDCGAGGSNV